MKKHLLLLGLLFSLLSTLNSLAENVSSEVRGLADTVKVKKMNRYYQFSIDLSRKEISRREIGRAYGAAIKQIEPRYGSLIDSYFAGEIKDQARYNIIMERIKSIWPNLPATVKDEIEGIAEEVCSTNKNIMGDGLLSPDEFKMLNLVGDVLRSTNCSGVGVIPEASSSGNMLVARNVDWDDGKTYQLSYLQAIINYKLSDQRSLTLIGYLGLVTAASGVSTNTDTINNKTDNLFFAILDSDIGGRFIYENRRSYPADLREYAEMVHQVNAMVNLLDRTAEQYTFGHLILLADRDSLGVYEDNLTFGKNKLRTVKDNPSLRIPWHDPNTIGAVNCFMLKTSIDNTLGVDNTRDAAATNKQTSDNIYVGNVKRWASQQRLLHEHSGKYSIEDLKGVSSYGPGEATNGFIYRPCTQQIIVFEPATGWLEVAFHPVGRAIQKKEAPFFQKVQIPRYGPIEQKSSF